MKIKTGPGMETPWKTCEHEEHLKKYENSRVKNWKFLGKSIIETMDFTSNFHGFYSDLAIFRHAFRMVFSCNFYMCSWKFHCIFMLSPWTWFLHAQSGSNFHGSFECLLCACGVANLLSGSKNACHER